MISKPLRILFAVAITALAALSGMPGTTAAVQPDQPGFNFPVNAAFCEPGYAGPFVGCTPWDGVTVSVLWETPEGTVSDACVTVFAERAATCTVTVPFGATVTAVVNPAMIPAGYVLEGSAEVQMTVPDGPPEGLFTGASFVLLPVEEPPVEPSTTGAFPFSAATAYCEPGYGGPFVGCTPWEGVTVTFVSSDGAFSTSCVTTGTERAAGCTVDVPFGATITASIDPAVIPAGYVLERSTSREFQIPDGPPEGEFSIAAFVLLPVPEAADASDASKPETTPADLTPSEVPAEGDTGTDADTDAEVPAAPGLPVAIYAGTCDATLPADAVVQLDDARTATGAQVGTEDALPVATSYSELDLAFDAVLDGSHVLAVSDPDGGAVLACGGLGGTLAANGAVAVGLEPVGDDGRTTVAYLSPLDGGSRTAITMFVVMPPATAP